MDCFIIIVTALLSLKEMLLRKGQVSVCSGKRSIALDKAVPRPGLQRLGSFGIP